MTPFHVESTSMQLRDKGIDSHRTLFYCLFILMAWIPIPIGSNREWSMAVFEVATMSIFAAWALRYALEPFVIPESVKEIRLPLVLLFFWICFPLIQMAPIPIWLGQFLSASSHEAYTDIPGLPTPEFVYLSLDRNATLSGFLRQCALVAVFFTVVSTVTTRGRLRRLLILFFIVGFVEAFYGLAVYFGEDSIGLWNPGHDSGTVSGTYVNQNHFAGLMEMTIPAGLGLLLMEQETPVSWKDRRAALHLILSLVQGQRGVILFGLLVMFAALTMSTSRGALGALAVSMAITVLMVTLGNGSKARELKVVLVGGVLAMFAVLWLGAGQLTSKLESSGFASNRGDLREISLQLVADSPLVGTGVGTYRWVLPQFKDQRFGSGYYEHAHNDYLEVLGEQGILGSSLLVIAISLITRKIFKAFRHQRDPLVRGALFAVIVGCTSLLLHSMVDFNLQIPANAAYFSTLLGIGVVAAVIGKKTSP